jgi:hypothetical protein
MGLGLIWIFLVAILKGDLWRTRKVEKGDESSTKVTTKKGHNTCSCLVVMFFNFFCIKTYDHRF